MVEGCADRRREAGALTRARLLDAALELLGERGEAGVTLRDVTSAAGANVAAVSYHFGSLRSLCDAAIEEALARYLMAQQEALDALGADATIEELATAFAAPMVSAIAAGGRDLSLMRIVARAGIDPPRGWARFDERFQEIRAQAVTVLQANTGGVAASELGFRTRCAAGLLNWLVLAPAGTDLLGRPAAELNRLLVPVLAGVLAGAPSTASVSPARR